MCILMDIIPPPNPARLWLGCLRAGNKAAATGAECVVYTFIGWAWASVTTANNNDDVLYCW